jgi:uncharacterized protein (TIGR01777 family)
MKQILVTGSGGFIGKELFRFLNQSQFKLIPLSHQDIAAYQNRNELFPAKELAGIDGIINLAGVSISQRWNEKTKSLILESRLNTTHFLADSLQHARELQFPIPSVFINASGIGYYGITPTGVQTEASPPGTDFLASVCQQWEQAALHAERLGIRTVIGRFGVVLGTSGGALPRMALPFHWGVGGTIGDGTQHLSWIHLKDLLQVLQLALTSSSLKGAYNFTSPNPVPMRHFAASLGKQLKKPVWTRLPGTAAKLLLGEMAEAILLADQQVLPQRLLKEGFQFQFPDLASALADLYPARE